MTAHKTTTHPVILLGVLFISTWCDTCHWTHTAQDKTEAAQAAQQHEKDNQ